MLYLATKIDEGNSKIKSFLELSSKYSQGIYLLNPYVQVLIHIFLYQKLKMPYLMIHEGRSKTERFHILK